MKAEAADAAPLLPASAGASAEPPPGGWDVSGLPGLEGSGFADVGSWLAELALILVLVFWGVGAHKRLTLSLIHI